MVDLVNEHAENMVVCNIPRDRFEAGLVDLVCLLAEDLLLVIRGIFHSRLHRRDLCVRVLDRFYDILLFVRIVLTCVCGIKLKQLGHGKCPCVGCSAGKGIRRIVNESHRRFKVSVVLAHIGAFIAHDIFVEGRQIAAVIFLVILAVMAQAGEHLARIDGVQALRLVDLHSRQYRENADVVINIHRMMLALLLGEEPIPQQAVEKLREIDDLPDLIFGDGLIERRKAFRRVLVVGLADRLCLADGNLENVIATGHACDDQLVIRDEHGVVVIIASVKPLLNIAFNRVHANNIGSEIKITQKVIAVCILREVEVAHGDVRTAGAEHHFTVSKTRSANLSVIQREGKGRLVALIGERPEKFVGVTEQHLIIAADRDPSFSQPFLKMLDGVTAEGFVELGLLKQRRATAHIKNGITAVFGKVGDFVFRNGGVVGGHIDLIAQKGRTVQHILQILKGRLKELADALTGEPDGIEKLIVGVRHHAVHKRGIVVSLDNTEDRAILAFVERVEKALALLLKGHILWHELEVFHAALGDDQLDVLDIARRGIARKPAYLCDVVIKEPILQVSVECAGLEKSVAQKHHAVHAVSVYVEYLGIQQSLAVPDDVFDLGFFLLCPKVVRIGFLDAYHIFGKAADSVANDEDGFLGKPDRALDTAERECDICLPGSLIGSSVGRKVAGAPFYHVRIQRFGNKKATTVAACSRASLVADIVDAVNIEAVGVELLTDLPTADVRGDGLVASLIRARIGIIFEILAEDSFRNRFFHRCIPAVLPEGYVYGDQRRFAVYGANADMIPHIPIGDAVTVQNVAVAVGFIQLDRTVEGKAHNGAAESLLAVEIGISDLVLVPSVHLCELQGIKTLIENTPERLGIGLAVFCGGKSVIFEHHTAFKGHNAHAFIFFRRHYNTSFCSDVLTLPCFAT